MYERFANKLQLPEVKQKIETYCLTAMKEILEAITKVETAMESQFPDYMDGIEDKTCKVYAEIQDSYIKNKTEMQEPTELEASDEDKKKLAANRLKRGAKQFEIRKKLYIAKTKVPLYECFTNASKETINMANELEETRNKLNEKVESVSGIFYSEEFQKRVSAVDKLRSTIGLNLMFLNDTLEQLNRPREGFEDVPNEISYAEMRLPFSMTSVTDTQKTYVDSIKNALNLFSRMKQVPQLRSDMAQMFQQQNNIWDTINLKKKELENPPGADLDKSMDKSNKERAKADAKKGV